MIQRGLLFGVPRLSCEAARSAIYKMAKIEPDFADNEQLFDAFQVCRALEQIDAQHCDVCQRLKERFGESPRQSMIPQIEREGWVYFRLSELRRALSSLAV